MIEALQSLGVTITPEEGRGAFGPDLLVTPRWPLRGGVVVDCGQAGTVMRFVAALAGFADGELTLTAHESALHRPMGAMIKALRDVGTDIDDGGHWALPFSVRGHGHVRGGEIVIDASASSQFVSGLLLAAPRFDVGLHLIHRGERLPSMPHIDMTVESLAHRGVHVERPARRRMGRARRAAPRQGHRDRARPLQRRALPRRRDGGGRVGLGHRAGRPTRRSPAPCSATSSRSWAPGSCAAAARSPSAPARTASRASTSTCRPPESSPRPSSALAAFADSPTTLYGIGHIRGHETDRIAALVGELRNLGGEAEELPDGIRIVPRPLHGGRWRAHHDHRLATTGALVGLAVPGVEIDDIGTTAKTMPEFPELWQRMLEGGSDDAASRPEAMQAS